jgi:hypothetical protein
VPHDEFSPVGDVEEDGESECVDEPLLNWKTRDCAVEALSVLPRLALCNGWLLRPEKPLRLLLRWTLFCAGLAPSGSGELVKELLVRVDGLTPCPVLFCRPGALEADESLFLESGPLSRSWAPGSPPKRGNSNEKLLLVVVVLPLPVFNMELKPEAIGGVRFSPVLLSDKRFRYSRSSICNL